MKKYIIECLGAFILSLIVVLSVQRGFVINTSILAAVTLGLFVYTAGHVSGAHINPAVTLGALTIGKIKPREAMYYIAAQFLGGLLTYAVFLLFLNKGIPVPAAVNNSFVVGLAELVGSFIFTFGIASVLYGKSPSVHSGFVIGGSLFIGIVLAATIGSSGILNPAVALGLRSFGFMYVFGPVLGSILGMQAYRYLCTE